MSDKPTGILGKVSSILLGIAAVAMVIMMVHVTSDIISKAITGRSIVGTNEMVTYYYMVASVFLPLAYVQYLRKHVIVELFTHNLSPKKVLMIDTGAAILSLIYMGLMAYAAFREALIQTSAGEYSLALHFSVITWPSRWVFALSCLGMVCLMVRNILDDVANLSSMGDDTQAENQ